MTDTYASDGIGADFRWQMCVSGHDIDEAVDALFNAIEGDGARIWNRYNTIQTRTTFRKMLLRAERGELKPPGQIKDIPRAAQVGLCEIRWVGLSVLELRGDAKRGAQIEVRLYWAVPPGGDRIILGLHCHEKRTYGSKREVRQWQDAEINRALDNFVGFVSHG